MKTMFGDVFFSLIDPHIFALFGGGRGDGLCKSLVCAHVCTDNGKCADKDGHIHVASSFHVIVHIKTIQFYYLNHKM